MSPPVGLEPLSAREFFKLKKGDQYRVYWAKDDNPSDVRLNYEVLTITRIDGDCIMSGGYAWYREEVIDFDSNELYSSRGVAKLYKPELRMDAGLSPKED